MVLSRVEAARRLGCKPETLSKWAAEGKIVARQVNGRYFFDEFEVERVKMGKESKEGEQPDEVRKLNEEAELLLAKTRVLTSQIGYEQATNQLNEVSQAKVDKVMAVVETQKAEIEKAFASTKKKEESLSVAKKKFEEYKRTEEEEFEEYKRVEEGKLEAQRQRYEAVEVREKELEEKDEVLKAHEQALERREVWLAKEREALRQEKVKAENTEPAKKSREKKGILGLFRK